MTETIEPSGPWKCRLCSVTNSKGEAVCRICDLPRSNQCVACKKRLGYGDHFCKYCGAMSAFFQANVYDPHERECARKESRKLISEWKKHGVTYLRSEDIEDYSLQLSYYGEVLG